MKKISYTKQMGEKNAAKYSFVQKSKILYK